MGWVAFRVQFTWDGRASEAYLWGWQLWDRTFVGPEFHFGLADRGPLDSTQHSNPCEKTALGSGLHLVSWWHLQSRSLHLSKSSRFSYQQWKEIHLFGVQFNWSFFVLFCFKLWGWGKWLTSYHQFLLSFDSKWDICCRCLNNCILECLLKESVHRHQCMINLDLHLGLNLVVKLVKIKLQCSSWPIILHMWIASLQQMLVNVI